MRRKFKITEYVIFDEKLKLKEKLTHSESSDKFKSVLVFLWLLLEARLTNILQVNRKRNRQAHPNTTFLCLMKFFCV